MSSKDDNNACGTENPVRLSMLGVVLGIHITSMPVAFCGKYT